MSRYRMVVLYPPPADPGAFLNYYTGTHLKLVARLPGLLRSEWGSGLRAMGGTTPYFCVWQGDFESADAMKKAMQSPEGQDVAKDVPNYATGGAVILHYAVSSEPAGEG